MGRHITQQPVRLADIRMGMQDIPLAKIAKHWLKGSKMRVSRNQTRAQQLTEVDA
jgi:hypothetical protein